MKQLKLKLFKIFLAKIAKMLKGSKTTDKLVSEDGSTELLAKGAEITEEALRKFLLNLLVTCHLKST